VSPHSANPAWSSRDAREWPEREVYQPRGDDRETGTGAHGIGRDAAGLVASLRLGGTVRLADQAPCGSEAPCGRRDQAP